MHHQNKNKKNNKKNKKHNNKNKNNMSLTQHQLQEKQEQQQQHRHPSSHHHHHNHHHHHYPQLQQHQHRYKGYDPRKFSSKTVLWFTRDEIQTLKSFAGCNFLLIFLSLIILLIIGILAATKSYPFTFAAGILVHKTFAGLLVFQLVISLIGYFGVQAENSFIIDMYIACNGILIVSHIAVLALYTYFADPIVISFFRSTILFKALTSLFIIINCILMWSAFVVELQIRTYGSVGSIKPLIPDHEPSSLMSVDLEYGNDADADASVSPNTSLDFDTQATVDNKSPVGHANVHFEDEVSGHQHQRRHHHHHKNENANHVPGGRQHHHHHHNHHQQQQQQEEDHHGLESEREDRVSVNNDENKDSNGNNNDHRLGEDSNSKRSANTSDTPDPPDV